MVDNDSAQTLWLDLNLLDIPPDARSHDPEQLNSLAHDMTLRKQLQNIVVATKDGGRYEVLAGVGRTLAARQLGWSRIRAEVREGLSPLDKALITISENEEREDLTPIDRGVSYYKAVEASQGQLDQRGLAKQLGRDETLISKYIALAEIPAATRENLNRFKFLGLRHLNELLRLKTHEDQLKLAEEASKQELSVKELKKRVDEMMAGSGAAPKKKQPPVDPFGTLWTGLLKDTGLPQGSWEVKYQSGGTWLFAVHTQGINPADKLSDWFGLMLKGMPRTSPASGKGQQTTGGKEPLPDAPCPTPETPENLLAEIQRTMPPELAAHLAGRYTQIEANAKAKSQTEAMTSEEQVHKQE